MTNYTRVETKEDFPIKFGDALVLVGREGMPSEFYRVGAEGFSNQEKSKSHLLRLERRKSPAKGYLHPTDPLQHLGGWVGQWILDEKGDLEPEPEIEITRRNYGHQSQTRRKPREYGQTLY